MNNKTPDGMDSKINHKGEGNHPLSANSLDQTLNHVQIDGTQQYKVQLALQHAHDASVYEKMGAIATDAYNFFFPNVHASEIHDDHKEPEMHPLTIDEVMEKYVDKDGGVLQEPPAYKEEPPTEHHEAHKPDQKELVQNEGGIQFDDGSAHYPLGLVQAGFITHGLTNTFFQNEGIRDLHHEDSTPETHSTHTPTVDLQITKVDDHGGSSITGAIGTAIPGQCITYTITVTNLGPDSVFGATMTDHLPSQLMFWEVIGTNGFTASGTNGGSFTDYSVNLASGESVVYTVKGLVDPCASPCDTMTNTATVQAPDGVIDTNPNNNTAVDKDNISGEADLKIVKYDDHGGNSETGAIGCVTPGTCIMYTVVVYNCGPAFVCGAEVKDILPHDLLNWNVVGSDGFTASGEQGGCFTDFINIAAGSSVTYTITGTIAADAACCDKNTDCGENQTAENQDCNSCDKTIENVATVTAPGCYTDTNPDNNTAVDTSKLTPQGDLKIEKYDDHGGNSETGAVGCVTPGTCITYTIVVSNCGPSDVCGAIVKDCLPDALQNWEVSGSNGFKASGCEGGTFTDNVYLEAGGTITYTIKGIIAADAACNTGCNDDTQLRTESQDDCCDPKYIQNTATITAPDCFVDTNPSNNVAVDKSKLTPEGDLKIEKFDDHGGNSVTGCVGDVVPGTCITYTIVVTNCGPSDVCGAIVKDYLPAALQNWEVCGSNGFQASGCEGGSFTDYSANIEAGCSITYTIKGTIAANAACDDNCGQNDTQSYTEGNDGYCDQKYIQNTATVTAPCGFTDTNLSNNTAVDVTKLSPEGDLKIVKYDDHGGNSETGCIGNITPGTCITYTIVVSNCGPSDVCGAIVKDCLPDALINWTVSGTNGFAACGWEGGSFADNSVNIAAGGTVTYTITGTIAADAACSDDGKCCDPRDIQNVATVEAPCGFTDTNPCNNIAVDQSHLTPQVDLSVVKLVDGKSCETISACCDNKELTYTITVSNDGPSDACGVIVTDKLPAGLVIDSISAPNGTSYNATTGVWTIGKVENCDNLTLTIKAHVEIPAVNLDFSNNQDTSHVYAFKTGQSFEAGNTLNLANANGTVSVTPDGYGVTTNYDVGHFTPSALPEINYDPATGKTEALLFDLGESATKATIEASKFFPAENGGDGEYGVLTAFDANGHEVGKVYFGPAENGLPSELNGATFIAATFDSSGSIGTFSIDSSLFNGASFQYLAFTALPYGAGVINNSPDPTGNGVDSGDYYIQKISYTPETTTIVNTAVVSSCTPDTNPDNDTSSATVKVENPHGDLSVIKYDDHGGNSLTGAIGNVIPGNCITYTVVVSNCGPSDVMGAIVKDCLPDALQNWEVSGSNGFSASGSAGGSFTDYANIDAGATVTYTIKGTIAADAACCNTGCDDQTSERTTMQTDDGCCDKTIENVVTVTGPACFVDTNPENNVAVDKGVLKPEGDLSVTKYDNHGGSSDGCVGEVKVGDCITYTIVVTNSGPSDACGAILTDCLPKELLNWTVCGPDGFTASGCEGGSFIDCLNIPAGCSVTYTVTGTVGKDWDCDNYLSNTATIIAPECFNDTNDCNNTATVADVIKEPKQHGCGDHRDDRCNDRDRHDDKCRRDDRCDDKRHDDKCRGERRHEGSEIAYCGIGAAVAHPKDHDFNDHNTKDDHKQNRHDNRHADNEQNCNSHCNDNNEKEHHEQQNTYHSQYADNNHHAQGSPLFLFAHDQLKDFHDKKDHDNDDKRDNKHVEKNNNHHGNGEHPVAENKHHDDKSHEGKELKDTEKNHTQHFASCNDEKDHCEKVGDNQHKDFGDNGKNNHDCNDQKHCGVQMSDNHGKEDHCKGSEHNDCQQQVGHKVDGILCGVIDDHGCKGQLSLAQLLSNQHGDKDHELGKALQDISEQAKHKNDCQTDQHNIECAQQAKVHDKVTPCLPHEHQVLSQMVEHHEMQQQAAHH